MYYTIRHTTEFRYSAPVSASIMEVRKQPRSEGGQRCRNFQLQINPIARIMAYRDHLGNIIHHFDVPGSHTELTIAATSFVELNVLPTLPTTLNGDTWSELDRIIQASDYWEMLLPSHYAQPTALLRSFARELRLERGSDPLSTLRELTASIREKLDYVPQSTRVNSPIDDALSTRRGVCQDFAHIMLALVRELGIPCRYVSGYLFHRREDNDRSTPDATHAWIEALLPELGWVGFDPTNNSMTGDRHIRTAVGRDYADVPPTRGVFKGEAETELGVAVEVLPSEAPPPETEVLPATNWVTLDPEDQQQQQQQQQ
ncbi:MAG: transglutaminase family protein [Pyrinomonadaceae bacterium]|nr:transglutaminase family protein [Pyrinomonadaceae bacterium]